MKKLASLITIILVSTLFTYSQMNPRIENATTLVWYGLDYTHTHFINTKYFSEPDLNIKEYFPQWNEVFTKEKGKYNIKGAFKVKDVITNLDVVTQRNNQTDLSGKITDEKFSINEQELNAIVKEIKFPETTGLGLICIVESLDKTNNKVSAFFTFVDLETKEIVYVKWLQGNPGGAGFRNYWVNPFADMLTQWIEVFR